ncbi:MAG: Omp28-related outer membrane protein [Bacteroidetes bacterium]|nr:Omp28-related outer membrane protein [Bacteroidota bacterium]
MNFSSWKLPLIASLVLSACIDEEPPFVIRKIEKPLSDTSYVTATLPAAQDKHVMLFDITGVRCNNCPEAAVKAKQIYDSRAGKVQLLSVYYTIPGGLISMPWKGDDTLNSAAANEMIDVTGVSVNSMPNGMIDQAQFGTSRLLGINEWDARVNERLALSTPLNIEVNSVYNASLHEAIIRVKVIYTQDKSGQTHRLTIGLSEDDILGKQSDKDTAGGIRYGYTHNHVLRAAVTAASGDVFKASLQAGRVFEKQYRVKLRSHWDAQKMHVFAFVQNDGDKTILNCRDAELAP